MKSLTGYTTVADTLSWVIGVRVMSPNSFNTTSLLSSCILNSISEIFFILEDSKQSFFNIPFIVYSDGLVRGVFFLLRIVLVVFLSTLLTISTSTIEINLGLEWVLSPLKVIKMPVAEISMMFSLTLRFIPTLMIETSKIMKAQASRGIDFSEGTFIEKVKQIVTLLIPMFFISITRAEDLANAMEARGYVIGEERTNIDELKFKIKDLISFFMVLLLLAFTIYLQVVR